MTENHQEICTCECHIEGRNIMHAFPCCDLCERKYLTEEMKIIPEKLIPLIGEVRFHAMKESAEEQIERSSIFEELGRIFPDKQLYHYLNHSLEELRLAFEEAKKHIQ